VQKFLEVARTGVDAVLLHPLRSVVTVAALATILIPYLVGLGLSQGIQRQAEDSIRYGADLYVTGSQFGRNVPVRLSAVVEVSSIDGVTDVVPRIVGGVTLGKDREPVVVVGISADRLPPLTSCVGGRMYGAGGLDEFVVGTELAKRLKLTVGAMIPPFYRSVKGERVSTVVGVFKSDNPIWQSRLIFTSLDTAARVFNQEGLVTDLLVYCRPGYQAHVSSAILRLVTSKEQSAGTPRLQVTAKEDLNALLPRGLLHREGIFNLHFLLAFAVGILVIMVTSGLGLSERRREIGILKATGWQTDEILLRSIVETLLLSIAGASLSVLLAFIWLNWFNGYWVASIFLAGSDAAPAFRVPFRLTPVPALLAFLISSVVVMTGTLYSTWRAAVGPPAEAMR
jgi:ABC-type lipoprotein release transport system permease subunit